MSGQESVSSPIKMLSGWPSAVLMARAVIGGVLMGLANLVPGISGGTMLLAAGVYTEFVGAIAGLSTLRFSAGSVGLLIAIGGSAAAAILLLAGTMRQLVVEQRWVMYSLFIGLTLGGVPLVWKLVRPSNTASWVGAVTAFGLMAVMALGGAGSFGQDSSTIFLFLSGLAGASAMILPGVSGGYLLLLLGQYEPILGAVDQLKEGLLGSGGALPDFGLVMASMRVVMPVGIGVAVGVVGVSNLLKWLLKRFQKPTLGVLLGLLVGAIVGLYPFQAPAPPEVGFRYEGRVLEAVELSQVPSEDWPVESFSPSAWQVVGATGLVFLGFGVTMAVACLGQPNKGDATLK
ncbi:MAG: hypothetical protein CL484_08890 [Acidobacteria bacterium]|nr:hypothetical protein [Acidobacteriota bacterium]